MVSCLMLLLVVMEVWLLLLLLLQVCKLVMDAARAVGKRVVVNNRWLVVN
jgi:hypothetical protein